MKNRRIILIVVALLTVAFLIWEFIPKDSGNEKIKITIIGENTSTMQSMMNIEKEYEEAHPLIDLDFKPNTFDDAFTKSNQDLANHTGLYDIIMQYNFSLSSFIRNNYVYTLDDLVKNTPKGQLSFETDIFNQTWRTVGYYYKEANDPSKGLMQVGYPYVANSMLLMYNKEMFNDPANQAEYKKQYGKDLIVPTTWEDYYKVARFFTNPQKKTRGVCMAGASGSFLYFEFVNYLNSMGGKVLDKNLGWEGDANTKVILNSPESLMALNYFISLRPFNNGNFTDVEQFKQMEIIKEGKTAMAICWEDVISMNIHSADSSFQKRFGFATIPGNKSVIGGGAYFVNKDSKHPKEAFDFIVYLMQPKTQLTLAKTGLSTPLKSVYDNQEVQSDPHMPPLKESLTRGGIYLEAGPDADMISEVLSHYIQKLWNNKLSTEEALSKAQAEIERKRQDIFSKLTTTK